MSRNGTLQDQQWNKLVEELKDKEPEAGDLSDRVMAAIDELSPEERKRLGRASRRRRVRAPRVFIAAIALLTLFTGAAFAAVEGWPSLFDRSGAKSMEIHATDWTVDPTYMRIAEDIQRDLPPGYLARVYIDPELNEDGKIVFWDFSVSTRNPIPFESIDDVAGRLDPRLAALPQPAAAGFELTGSYVLPELAKGAMAAPVFATDAATGLPYAYETLDISGGDYEAIFWHFAKDGRKVQLNVFATEVQEVKFYDIAPGQDRVHQIHGVDVYEFEDTADGKLSLRWAETHPEGALSYTLFVDAEHRDDLFEFAEKLFMP